MSVPMRTVQAKYFQAFQMFPWTVAVEITARGEAVPALFLQERTCRATRRASTFLETHSSSGKEVERSWRGQASAGAVQVLEHLDSWGRMSSVYKMSPCARSKPQRLEIAR